MLEAAMASLKLAVLTVHIAITSFLIGRQNTVPLHIRGLLSRGITPEVNAASVIIFIVSVAVIVVLSRLMRSDESIVA